MRWRGVPTFAKAHFGHPCLSSRQKLNGKVRGKSLTGLIKICDALFRPAFAIKKSERLFYIANSNGLTLYHNAFAFSLRKNTLRENAQPYS